MRIRVTAAVLIGVLHIPRGIAGQSTEEDAFTAIGKLGDLTFLSVDVRSAMKSAEEAGHRLQNQFDTAAKEASAKAAALDATMDELQDTRQQLNEAQDAADALRKTMAEEATTAAAAAEALKEQVADRVRQIEQLNSQLAGDKNAAAQGIAAAHEEATKLREQIKTMNETLTTTAAVLEKRTVELADEKRRAGEARSAAAVAATSAQQNEASARAGAVAQEAAIKAAKEATEAAKLRAEEAERTIVDLRAQLSGSVARASGAETGLADHKQKLEAMETRARTAESALETHKQMLSDKISALAASQGETKAARDELSATQVEKDGIIAERDSKISEHEGKLSDRENDIVRLNALVAVREKDLDDIKTKLESAKAWRQDPIVSEVIRSKALNFAHANPVIEGAMNESIAHIVPQLQDVQKYAYIYINQTHGLVRGHASRFVSKESEPIVSGVLTYGIVFFPLILTLYCLTNIKAVFRLRPLLLFCHSYLLALTLGCAVAAMVLDLDPLTLLYDNTPGVYVMMQMSLLAFFAGYFLLQTCAVWRARSRMSWTIRLLQVAAAGAIGFAYYKTVFTPAMFGNPPARIFVNSIAVPYLISGFVFSLILLLETHYLGARNSRGELITSAVTVSIEAGPDAQNKTVRQELGLSNGWIPKAD